MNEMKSVAIFCGSSAGNCYVYQDVARELTNLLCGKKIKIITGGGHVGLMGVIADEAISINGHIIGVIPQFLVEKEVAHDGLSELLVVDTMHERKQKIVSIADGFIALPGGFGTLDELFEIITWAQLSLHNKPIGILNANGFFDNIIAHIHEMVADGFVDVAYLDLIIIEPEPDILLTRMMSYEAKVVDKAELALGKKKNQ